MTNTEVFAFAGDPCPTCNLTLRVVGGGHEPDPKHPGKSLRVDVYRCECGHEFTSRVETLSFGRVLTRGLRPVTDLPSTEGSRVHFA